MAGLAETISVTGLLRRLVRPVLGRGPSAAVELLPVLPAEKLLTYGQRPTLRRRIDTLLGVPRPHLEALFHAAILSYARFVQQLPASEAHHHAGPGGMLDHGLEVAAGALALRRGYLLPQGAEPEHLARKRDLWTYAVFTAALLHDIGKPAVDQRILLFDSKGRSLGTWDPWLGPMAGHAAGYQVTFPRDRIHGLHERVAPLLARFIVPAAGLSWLGGDREVLTAWVATISGDREMAGVLGEIITRADGESVARNLGAGDSVRLPTARAKPLHEKLLTALRYLLSENELPLNRDGAAGWLVGDSLWLVSKRAVDALRAQLLQEGHEGIPSRNDRIFDVLQEHGLAVPNGERAIWRARVAGDGWAHELTLIRVPVSRVWPDAERRPDPFPGTVTPLDQAGEAVGDKHDEGGPSAATPDATSQTIDTLATGGGEALVGNVTIKAPPPAAADEDPAARASLATNPSDAGQRFLAWLRDGVVSRRIQVNTVNARVHVVAEGVLLVSPGIFRDFAVQHPEFEWSNVQKRFQKLKHHQKTSSGTNIHRYRVVGKRKHSSINGLLIPDAAIVFGSTQPPPPNPHLNI